MAGHQRDRRGHQRFQVVGLAPVALTTSETLRVLDLGTHGALVESAVPLSANGEYRMKLMLPGHVADVLTKVRRVEPAADAAAPMHYRIGLEFFGLSTETEETLAGFIAAVVAQA